VVVDHVLLGVHHRRKALHAKVSAVGVVTSRMFAPGAIACAVSTSRETSSAHALLSLLAGAWLPLGGALGRGRALRVELRERRHPDVHVTPSSPHIAGRWKRLVVHVQVVRDGVAAVRVDDRDSDAVAVDAAVQSARGCTRTRSTAA